MAVYPLAEKKRVVLFANCGHPEITELSDWVFRNFPTGKQEAHKMVKFAYDELGIRTISVLFINDAFGEGAMKVIKEEFEKRGGKILRTEAFEKDNVDFRSLIGRVLQSQPQAIYIYGYGNANGLVVKQTRELGYEKYVLGSYNFSIEPTLGIAKEALEGSYFTSPMFDSNSPAAEIERFVNDFKQKYGVPPLWNTVYEYDAIQVLAKVIGQGSFSGESIRSNLKNVGDFNGFAGKYFALPYGEWESELTVKTFRNGRQVVVAK
jgi:branched-chain amino acid transport system substrate-binding protein